MSDSMVVKMKVTNPHTKKRHVVNIDVEDELFIDQDKLNDEFAMQASNVAWWLVLSGWKSLEVASAKALLDQMKAEAYLYTRKMLEAPDVSTGKPGKPTEALISAHTATDEKVMKQDNKYRGLMTEYKVLQGICKGMTDRTYTLSSLGSYMRATSPETGGELSLNESADRLRRHMEKQAAGHENES